MCRNTDKKTPVSTRSPQKRYKSCQVEGFYWYFPTSWQKILPKIGRKDPKKCHWRSQHAAEVEDKGVEKFFWTFFQFTELKNWKKKQNPGSEWTLEAHIDISIKIFPLINVMAIKIEYDPKWKNI